MLIIGIALIVVISFAVWRVSHNTKANNADKSKNVNYNKNDDNTDNIAFKPFDIKNPPKFIQADFVELDKVYVISKFRSGVGHDFSLGDEKCRSMKH